MAYDEGVAERLRERLAERIDLDERKMFGGLAFLLHGNMCCGVVGEVLMARVGPDHYKAALKRPFAREMDFTGRPLKGFIYVDPPGFSEEGQLDEWLGICRDFVDTLPPK